MPPVTDIAQRLAALSPERREILLRELARTRRNIPEPGPALPPLAANPRERFEPFPLTDVQQVYWAGRSGLFDLPTPGPGATIYLEYEIPGNDRFIPAFEAAMRRLFDRHEMLRVVMLPDGRQRYLEQLPEWRVETADLRLLSEPEREAGIAAVRERFRYHPGAVGQWPLFGFLAHLLDGERIRLHAWFDAWLMDGLSRDVLVRDLLASLDKPDAPLPPLECTYRDYALAWEALRETELYRESRDYWLRKIPSLPPPPDLPLVNALRPDVQARFSDRQQQLLDPEAWARLKSAASRRGLTPTAVLVTAFSEVLRAWSGSPHYSFGLDGTYWPPIHPQLREVVGNFNTLHILAADQDSGTFLSRALYLQEQLLTALDKCLFSGFRVLREMNRRQGGSQRSLMPVLFNSLVELNHPAHQGRPATAAQPTPAAGAEEDPGIEQIEISANLPQVLLTAAVFERRDGSLQGRLQAAEELFRPGVIPELWEAFAGLVTHLASEEPAWESRRFHFAGSLPAASGLPEPQPSASPGTLHALVAAQARSNPGREAVRSPGLSLSFGELERRAGAVARRLRDLGAGPGQLVAVFPDRGWEQAVALLGALSSGATCLPLDLALPPDSLQAACRQHGVRWAVGRSETLARLGWLEDVRWVVVDDAGPEGEEPFLDLDSGSTAYSAGSSLVGHGIAAATVTELGRRLDVRPGDRLLSLSPPASDLALLELLTPLAAGAAVVLPAAGDEDPGIWARLAAESAASHWSAPPSLLDRLIACLPEGGVPAPPRWIALARGTVPVALPGRLRAVLPSSHIAALRGFPETGGVSAIHEIKEVPDDAVRFPAGTRLPGHVFQVLDPGGEPKPPWVAGDLYLSLAGERAVRTGFMARYRPDGEVEILEREDSFQARIAGATVELRRVEAALERHPSIRAAVVQPLAVPRGGARLAAWVLPAPGASPSSEELAAFLRARLPSAMVPAWFEILAQLPLDATGEVDRGAMPPVDTSLHGHRERDLARLWSEILETREPLGATDNFFEAGGDSFAAARMLSRLRETFVIGQNEVSAFFEEPTIRTLAGLLRPGTTPGEEPKAATPVPAKAVASVPAARSVIPFPALTRGMKTFLMLWAGQFLSAIGTSLGGFALGVWVFEKTGSATQFTMIGFAAGLTMLLASPFAGSLADRWDRRKLMMGSNLGSGLMTLALAGLFASNRLETWHVYPFVVVMVILTTFQGPALTASISLLVPRHQLARAAGMSQMSRAVAQIIGPLAASVLVSRIGFHGVILFDCATFLALAGTLAFLRLPSPRPQRETRPSPLRDLAYSWRYLRERTGLFVLLTLFATTNFALGIVQALLAPLVLSFASAVELGYVSSTAAAGVLLGSVVLTTWGGPRRRIPGIFLILVIQSIILLLGGMQPSIPLIALAAFTFMFTVPFINGFNQAILQSKVAAEVQGRVFAMSGMIAASTLPLASLLSGPLADRLFEPALKSGGALASSVGQIIGVGPGRGIGLLFILVGVLILLTVCLAFLNPRLRRVETEVPDAVG